MTRVIRADRTHPPVVAGAVADAAAEARAILARAEQRAAQSRERTLAEARAEARAEVAAGLLQLAERSDALLGELEREAIRLALLLARRIVGDALEAEPDRLAAIVAPLLERVRRARQVTVRVHPQDRDALEARLPGLCARAQLASTIRIEADAALARGDCVVISDAGVLDARIDTRLEALARALGAA